MSSNMNILVKEYDDRFLAVVLAKHPGEVEFLPEVRDAHLSVGPFVLSHPQFVNR